MHTYDKKPPDDLLTIVAELTIGNALKLLMWLFGHPLCALLTAGSVAGTVYLGWQPTLGIAVLAAAGLGLWWLVHRGSFRACVARPLRRRWRMVWRYEARWKPAMTYNSLAIKTRDRTDYPKLHKLRCSDHVDRVLVILLHGQTPDDFEKAADGLAHSMRARVCRVRRTGPGAVWLEFHYADTLTHTVPALPVPDAPQLDALPVGTVENGHEWTIRLEGTHVLVAGVTGAGKGSVVWSIIRSLARQVAVGVVELWVIDPKGGMELAPGQAMFARFEAQDFERMAELLDNAVALMKARAQRLAGVTRQHRATLDEPMVVVIIDEVANLTAYLPDRKLRERINQSLALLLTQGRAVGVNVVAALQDPRKEVLGLRNLFPTRVALRLDEPQQVDMVLGAGSRDRGALCDQIAESQPGVGYVRLDGQAEPIRVRAAYVTDDDIAELARTYPAPRAIERTAGPEVDLWAA